MTPDRKAGGPPAATWLSWPTLREEVPGWSLAIDEDVAASLRAAPGTDGAIVMVELVGLSGSSGAAVAVAGRTVAPLEPERAGAYTEVASRLDRLGLAATCRARISADGTGAHLEVLGSPALGGTSSPFLPPFDEVAVAVEAGAHVPAAGSGSGPLLGSLSNTSGVTVVSVEGAPVGHLTGPARRAVDLALASGFHATCHVVVQEGADGVTSVVARLPEGV